MLLVFINLLGIGAILFVTQYLWQKKLVKGEGARKFAHILIGSFVALWPLYLTWQEIQTALIIGLLSALIVRHYKLFASIYDVQRSTFGDIAAPAVMLAASLLEPTRTIFAVGVLHVAFADGMAAAVGSRFGHTSAYNIFKQKKSAIGTATFYTSSVIIMTAAAIFQPTLDVFTFWLYIGVIPVMTTLAENVTPRGLDNVTVPFVAITLLLLFS